MFDNNDNNNKGAAKCHVQPRYERFWAKVARNGLVAGSIMALAATHTYACTKITFRTWAPAPGHLLMTMPFDRNHPVYSAKKLFTEISPKKNLTATVDLRLSLLLPWLIVCLALWCPRSPRCCWNSNIARTNAYNFVFPFFLHLKTWMDRTDTCISRARATRRPIERRSQLSWPCCI